MKKEIKKYWKITFADARESMKAIGVCDEYIEICLDEYSDFIKYNTDRYTYISYNSHDNFCWGWGWCEDEDYYLRCKFEFAGEIKLRKEKLKKLALL